MSLAPNKIDALVSRLLAAILLWILSLHVALGQAYQPTKDGLPRTMPPLKPTHKLVATHTGSNYPESTWVVQCGLQDKSGNLWFGTNNDGVYRYDGREFVQFSRTHGLCNNDVLCMLEDHAGNFWLGTRGGLCRLVISDKEGDKNQFLNVQVTSMGEYGPPNFVWSILQDKGGRLWLGTNEGVFVSGSGTDLEGPEPSFVPVGGANGGTRDPLQQPWWVTDITVDDQGNIWAVSSDPILGGLFRFSGSAFVKLTPCPRNSFGSILAAKDGRLYCIGGNLQVFRLDDREWVNFSEVVGLEGVDITAISEDQAGNIWLASDCKSKKLDHCVGLWKYDGKSLQNIPLQENMANKAILLILEDLAGNIWVGTRNTSLFKFDGKSWTSFSQ